MLRYAVGGDDGLHQVKSDIAPTTRRSSVTHIKIRALETFEHVEAGHRSSHDSVKTGVDGQQSNTARAE